MNYVYLALLTLGVIALVAFIKDKAEQAGTRGGGHGSTGVRVKPTATDTRGGSSGSTGARITDEADPDDDMFGTRGGGHGSTGARVKPNGQSGSTGV